MGKENPKKVILIDAMNLLLKTDWDSLSYVDIHELWLSLTDDLKQDVDCKSWFEKHEELYNTIYDAPMAACLADLAKAVKPPLGLVPRAFHDQERYVDVCDAIRSYFEAGLPINEEWIKEHNELVEKIEFKK